MMPRRRSLALLVLAMITAAGCASTSSRGSVSMALDAAIAGSQRPETDRARDSHRHPRETLLFFGLRPNQTVVEIAPGGGWYTRIIAPVLREHGRYIAAMPPVVAGNAGSERSRQNYHDLLAAHPQLFDRVQVADFSIGNATLAPPGSVDLVLTFRNVHNWMNADTTGAVFEAMYRALKPGGTLGLVEHRADPAAPEDPRARSGYVSEAQVIRFAEAAGFEFVDRTEINANPRDTRDHPEGVWTLPPTLRLGDQDRERYLAIGESDRMTLRFVKPIP